MPTTKTTIVMSHSQNIHKKERKKNHSPAKGKPTFNSKKKIKLVYICSRVCSYNNPCNLRIHLTTVLHVLNFELYN